MSFAWRRAGPLVQRALQGADAAAICEAIQRPHMRFVPLKDVEQQSRLMVHLWAVMTREAAFDAEYVSVKPAGKCKAPSAPTKPIPTVESAQVAACMA